MKLVTRLLPVVPYIGTWIETGLDVPPELKVDVVPYIGTWIETVWKESFVKTRVVVPYIGTWIETNNVKV